MIRNAIYRFLFNLAFRCTKTAIREPRRREPCFYPIFFPLMIIWYCVAIWRVACVGVAWQCRVGSSVMMALVRVLGTDDWKQADIVVVTKIYDPSGTALTIVIDMIVLTSHRQRFQAHRVCQERGGGEKLSTSLYSNNMNAPLSASAQSEQKNLKTHWA